MKIFLDTADIAAIQKASSTGLIDGITTNPTLLARYGQPPMDVLCQLCALNIGPVSIEVTAAWAEEMVKQAEIFLKISSHVVIKVPLTPEGLKACKILSHRNVPVNVTLCFSLLQALLAAKAGATYISPFIGRLDDTGAQGAALLSDIRTVYANYGYGTKILAASLRHPVHVMQACAAKADIVTLPPLLFDQMYSHPLTEQGLKIFDHDWTLFKHNVFESPKNTL